MFRGSQYEKRDEININSPFISQFGENQLNRYYLFSMKSSQITTPAIKPYFMCVKSHFIMRKRNSRIRSALM
ncbi:hypothetical protein MC04F14_39450 [Escherichia coli]|nr:hypothetical protein ECP02994382_1961 [Escherichia coli P0299438.2]BDT25219.1 hypothetical protein CF204P1_39420 [Citrobacter freundii]GHK35837.1 hypothetical protein ECZU06_29620 [Escherichia coli]GHK71088.1 hypothetical protein ECZU12_24990 [Escherichia coli]GHK86452.1 hypothetical protein ECZU17_23890 [Escherichia coli]